MGDGAVITVGWDKSILKLDIYLPKAACCKIDYHTQEELPLPAKRKRITRGELNALIDHFSEKSNIPPPLIHTTKLKRAAYVSWWEPLYEIAAICDNNINVAKEIISRTIERMRQDNLTMYAPRSIIKVAINEHSLMTATRGQSVW